jgi:predicted Zn-ribbon and HTH transcriptional regulator
MKKPQTWRELSEAAAREQDPDKLLELVEQLNEALEAEEYRLKRKPEPDRPSGFAAASTHPAYTIA